jgi:hypothetical protein
MLPQILRKRKNFAVFAGCLVDMLNAIQKPACTYLPAFAASHG